MRVILVHNTRARDGRPMGELRRVIEEAGHEIVREIDKRDGVAIEDEDRLNIPSVGPNLVLSPEADPGDGFLDLVLAGESERETLRALLEADEDGPERRAPLPVRRVRSVEMSDGGTVHVDDDLSEPGTASAMALTVQPGQVEFLV